MREIYREKKVVQYKENCPIDEDDHYLDYHRVNEVDEVAYEFTSPYALSFFKIGSEDEFICFDYAFLGDDRIILHAEACKKEGSTVFVKEFGYEVLPKEWATGTAVEMVDDVLEDLAFSGVAHDYDLWKQDPHFFSRTIAFELGQLGRALVKRDPIQVPSI